MPTAYICVDFLVNYCYCVVAEPHGAGAVGCHVGAVLTGERVVLSALV